MPVRSAVRPLEGRVALVTGGGIRVGRAIAQRLAEAGASVAIHYNRSAAPARTTVASLRKLKVKAESFAADLRDAESPQRLIREVRAWGGRLDILVNNAGAFERRALADLDGDAVRAMLAVNVEAPLQLIRHAAPLLGRKKGVVVNVLDVAAFHAWRGFAHYCASKAALAMVTRCLALELAPRVRVLGVAPGTVAFPDDYPAEDRKRIVASIPLGRVGSPQDIARAVFYLVTEPYLTGTTLAVDGGRLAGSRLPL